MTSANLVFDKLAYIDRLKTAGAAEGEARAHAEALDLALRETVVTKHDLEIAVRDLTIRAGGIAMVLFRGARGRQLIRRIAIPR